MTPTEVKDAHDKYLTQSEVDNLPEGAKVVITWSGGNGPYIYIIHKRKAIHGSFVTEHNPNVGWWDGQINFVGSEKYHTKVKELP